MMGQASYGGLCVDTCQHERTGTSFSSACGCDRGWSGLERDGWGSMMVRAACTTQIDNPDGGQWQTDRSCRKLQLSGQSEIVSSASQVVSQCYSSDDRRGMHVGRSKTSNHLAAQPLNQLR